SEKDAAIDLAGVHLLPHAVESALGQQVADPGGPTAHDRLPEIIRDLTGRALRRLERDIAGEAFGDHDIDDPPADVIALDETVIIDRVEIGFAQQAAGLLDLFLTLD